MENKLKELPEWIAGQRLEIMTRIHHPEEYYKQAFAGKGIDISLLTHAEISMGVAAMKAVEADFLIWASKYIPRMSSEDMDNVVLSLINKGW